LDIGKLIGCGHLDERLPRCIEEEFEKLSDENAIMRESLKLARITDARYQELVGEQNNQLALLGRVYREVGNESPGFNRHALTPGLRDDIRDCLNASGRLKKHQHEPCADVNCQICNRRYEAEKQSMNDLAASGGIVDAP
jgi:hypothetical protein